MIHNAYAILFFSSQTLSKGKILPEDLNSIYIAKELQIWKCLAEDYHLEEHPPKVDFDRILGSLKFDVVPRYSQNNSQNALTWWPVSWPVRVTKKREVIFYTENQESRDHELKE